MRFVETCPACGWGNTTGYASCSACGADREGRGGTPGSTSTSPQARHENPEEAFQRAMLERLAVLLAGGLKQALPPELGFALVIFDFGEGRNLAYASSGQRADMQRALAELLERLAS